jgi:hypothetical protein
LDWIELFLALSKEGRNIKAGIGLFLWESMEWISRLGSIFCVAKTGLLEKKNSSLSQRLVTFVLQQTFQWLQAVCVVCTAEGFRLVVSSEVVVVKCKYCSRRCLLLPMFCGNEADRQQAKFVISATTFCSLTTCSFLRMLQKKNHVLLERSLVQIQSLVITGKFFSGRHCSLHKNFWTVWICEEEDEPCCAVPVKIFSS